MLGVLCLVYLLVGIGGILGSVLRYFIAMAASGLWGSGFPIGTVVINLTGSFFLGWFSSKFIMPQKLPPYILTAISTGVIGSYTTFSTFCLETVNLMEAGEQLKALLYLLISLVGGLLFVKFGMRFGNQQVKKEGNKI